MNLRPLRSRTELISSDVAIELDCALSSIRNWENGRKTPKMEVWQGFRLRDVYQCTEE